MAKRQLDLSIIVALVLLIFVGGLAYLVLQVWFQPSVSLVGAAIAAVAGYLLLNGVLRRVLR